MGTNFLTGNRLAWLKFGLVLGGITLLCYQADRHFRKTYPGIGSIRTHPERNEGKEVQFLAKKIVHAGKDQFTLVGDRIPITVRAKGSWKKGQFVTVHGTVKQGEVLATRVKLFPGYRWKRGLVYLVSLLVMSALLFGFLRRTNLPQGVILPRDE
jgi:hypothetical protein